MSRDASSRSIDLPGAVLVAGGLGGIVFGLGNFAVDGWKAPATWMPVLAGVLLIAAFVAREMRTEHPLMPFSFFWIGTAARPT